LDFCKIIFIIINIIILISKPGGGAKRDMYEFKEFKSLEEGIAALSDQKSDPDALAQLADPNENMCLFFTIGASLSQSKRFAWIGGREEAQRPGRVFLNVCGNKKKTGGWNDVDVFHYLRYLVSIGQYSEFKWKRVRSYETFLGQHYFPISKIFQRRQSRCVIYVFQSYALPKGIIAEFKRVLNAKKNQLLSNGCSPDRTMKLLEAYAFNTEEENTLPCQLHNSFVAVEPKDQCPHVSVIKIDASGDIFLYDNVNKDRRMRVHSIIDVLPYTFEYYRVHVLDVALPGEELRN